jgi:hypothetical protein
MQTQSSEKNGFLLLCVLRVLWICVHAVFGASRSTLTVADYSDRMILRTLGLSAALVASS